MRSLLVVAALGIVTSGLYAPSAHAQEAKFDSATIARANKPVLRWGEVLGVVATTGLAFAFDQPLSNRIRDPYDRVGRTLSDVGNTFGSGIVVYPALLAVAIGSKALNADGVYGVSSRALKSTLLAGAAAMVLKTIVGRERPGVDNAYQFHLFRLKDNSFPSGHTALAFALATSLSREIKGQWDDVGFFTLATLTGYARMHDKRHWASDVVFGAGVGILAARFIHRREAKLLIRPSGVGASLTF